MDFTKTNAPNTTITRNTYKLSRKIDNIYEMVVIISKRANQISIMKKNRLDKKLSEFATFTDNLEEIFENKEQIEISRYYERLPKPTLIATQEYIEDKIHYRIADFEENDDKDNILD